MTRLLHSRLYSTRKWALVFLVGSVGWGATETVCAAPNYSGHIFGVGSVPPSPNPVVLTHYFQMNDVDALGGAIGVKTSGAQAVASYGRLQGHSFADYLNVREFFFLGASGTGAQESSSFSLDNLVITGPPGNIMVSFNFAITGGLIATDSGGPFMSSGAHVQAGMGWSSTGGAAGVDLGRLSFDSSGNQVATGIFSAGGGTFMGTSPFLPTFAGDPGLGFSLSLETRTDVSVGFGAVFGSAFGSSSFFARMGDPTTGLVANLPAGYTLNSTDGHIVDNHLVPPQPGDVNWDGVVDIFDVNLVSSQWGRTGPVGDANGDMMVDIFDINLISSNWTPAGAAVVPEPGTLSLLCAGAMLLAVSARARVRQRNK